MQAPSEKSVAQDERFHPAGHSIVAATVGVAATYVYFLIFAQFGLLKAVEEVAPAGDEWLRPIMAVMGLAGIAGSFGMARIFSGRRGRALLMAGYGIAGAGAGWAWLVRNPGMLLVSAALAGAGTGMITVGLAAILRREVGREKLGRCIGLGTGAAYAFCNLPLVFNAGAEAQAGLGMVAASVGLIAVRWFDQPVRSQTNDDYDYGRSGVVIWTGIFLALVWLDSAAFFSIQQTPELKEAMWAGGLRPFLIAGIHFLAAVLAGLALDRRWMMGTVSVGTGLLFGACLLLGGGANNPTLEVLLYAAGVSVYSTALVFYPARSSRPGLAAIIYGVAGWLGSGLGIGLARFYPQMPWGFIGSAGALIATMLTVRWVQQRSGVQKYRRK